MTDKVWWAIEVLANVSTKVYSTVPHPDGLRPGTAGAQLGHFSGVGQQASYLGLQSCWKYGLAQKRKSAGLYT